MKLKKIATVLLAAVFILQGICFAYADEPAPENLYRLTPAGTYDLFMNNVDGYSLFVDKGMYVDMSYSSICAVLENENKRIEIYKQDTSSIGRTAYVNYSNQFLKNTIDHYTEFNGEQAIGGRSVTVTAWSRDKLVRIANDKNHYVCIELAEGRYVYTIFIKANAPIYQLGGYAYLIENFSVSAVIANAYTRTSDPVNVERRDWNDETKAFFYQYFAESAPLTWGIFEPETAMFEYEKLTTYEQYFEYEFPILLNYSEFENNYQHPNLRQRLDTAYSYGKVLELTLQTGATEDGGNMVYDILKGEYDPFLRDYARVIADFGHPVLFRLGNEMNGDWCPYSSYNTSKDTMIYKEFYQYVYQFFKNANAQNVIWIWNPNCKSFPNFQWNNELMYYPGDAYVDIIGMTAYNTGTYYSHIGETWQEFDELYNPLYNKYCRLFNQPLMITEFASASMGGDKEQWVIDMFEDIKGMDRIKVAIWWDGADWDGVDWTGEKIVARSYMIDESQQLMSIFKRFLSKDWREGVFG